MSNNGKYKGECCLSKIFVIYKPKPHGFSHSQQWTGRITHSYGQHLEGRLRCPPAPERLPLQQPLSSTETSRSTLKCKALRKRKAPHREYSKLEDCFIIRAVELNGWDWRAVLAFLKWNWEVELSHDCAIGDRSIQDRLQKWAATLLTKDSKAKNRWVQMNISCIEHGYSLFPENGKTWTIHVLVKNFKLFSKINEKSKIMLAKLFSENKWKLRL